MDDVTQGTRILVVDDDPRLLRVTSRVLSASGYDVREAPTGGEALQLAQDFRPDLIVLDVILPDIGGVEVCRRIKADETLVGTYVLMFSGLRTGSENQAVGLEAGADGYIVRPITNRELLARVEAMLRLKRVEDALRQQTVQLQGLREVGLDLTAQLDLDDLLHSIVSWACQLSAVDAAGLYLYRPEQDVLEMAVACGSRPLPVGNLLRRGEGLSGKVWETGEPLIVEDYLGWEGRAEAYVDYGPASVVGVPILWRGEFLGVLNVGDPSDPPRVFSPADVELLTMLAAQVAVAIKNARLHEQTQRDSKTKAAMLAEIHHRVKNNFQIVSSLLDFQADFTQDEQAVQALRDSQYRVHSMARVHELLYQAPDLAHVDFGAYVEAMSWDLFLTYLIDPGSVKLTVDVDSLPLGIKSAVPCGLILNELLSNALKYAFPSPDTPGAPAIQDGPEIRPEVRVSFRQRGELYELEVSDNGVGLPPGFEFPTENSLGLFLIDTFAQQLKGSVLWESDGGTTCRVAFAP